MPIITISRGSYSRGKEVAEALAGKLGYECISREILVEASQQFNVPEIQLARALHDAPSLLQSFQGLKDVHLNYFKSTFLEHMRKGNIVYHGLAGHFFLQDISHVLKVRINACMSDRVKREMTKEYCSEAEALSRIKKDDNARRKWSKHLYAVDTHDSRLYDMVLCVDSLTVSDIVETLALAVDKKQFQETGNSLEKLQKASIEASVKAMVTTVSSNAEVRVRNSSSVELFHLDGPLKSNTIVRQNLTDRMKKELDIPHITYSDPVYVAENYINTFYNIGVQ